MIYKVKGQSSYNPIGEHLKIVPTTCERDERLNDIYRSFREQFDHTLSRVLIFVTSRRRAEELSDQLRALVSKELPWKNKVHFFHAGMPAEERNETYENFLSGDVLVLFATKAFGMGMDIPNIHFVFHYESPSALEDYLQEIGRAGRDPKQLEMAGYSRDKPIHCVLYATKDDFKRIRDRNSGNQLTWRDIEKLHGVIRDYVGLFRQTSTATKQATPLPLNFLETVPYFEDRRDLQNLQRLGLYWLSRLGRVKIGNYVPAFLQFKRKDGEKPTASGKRGDKVRLLARYVQTRTKKFPKSAQYVHVSSIDLLRETGASDFRELFRLIALAQKERYLHVHHPLTVRLPKAKHRINEVEYLYQNSASSPVLSAAYSIVKGIFAASAIGQSIEVDSARLETLVTKALNKYFRPENWSWITGESERQKRIENAKEDIGRHYRQKAMLRLIGQIPRVGVRTTMDKDNRSPIYLVTLQNVDYKKWLERHEVLAGKVLTYLYEKAQNERPFSLADALIDLEVIDYDYTFLESTLFFLKGMGYLHFSSPLIPMAVELYLSSDLLIDISDRTSPDHSIFEDFQENKQLKELRLGALETLFEQESEEARDRFIQTYFRCNTSADIMALVEESLAHDHPLLRGYREEALKQAVYGKQSGKSEDGRQQGGLSKEQLAVYKAPLDEAAVVVAGPGSGKTHTLMLRLARLIHEEEVDPKHILVLAYNRAVVAELKHRLNDLLGKLGYRRIAASLKVFTFHGLVRYCIPNQVQDEELERWIEIFNETIGNKSSAGRVQLLTRLGKPRYVFVDEFQDITRERYEMLKLVADPKKASVTAIGDPNQSIYGYERAKAGDPREAEPFFDEFQQDYSAIRFDLKNNYRSFEGILKRAEKDIEPIENKMLKEELKAQREPKSHWPLKDCYVQDEEAEKGLIVKKLRELLGETKDDGSPYNHVAVLCRSNEEVYRCYEQIMKEGIESSSVKIRVQGDASSLRNVREIAHLVEDFDKQPTKPLPADLYRIIEKRIKSELATHKNWSEHYMELLLALVSEFMHTRSERATYGDLLDYLSDILRKDEGQCFKLYQFWKKRRADQVIPGKRVREIILSTVHRIKGLEFDAVLLSHSYASVPHYRNEDTTEVDEKELSSLINEERRIYYVAMTRARDRLVKINWKREEALEKGMKFHLDNKRERLGIPFSNSLEYVYLNLGANKDDIRRSLGFRDGEEYMAYLENDVAVGDRLSLRWESGNWFVIHAGKRIMRLSNAGKKKLREKYGVYGGLRVANVVRRYYHEVVRSDEKKRTEWAKGWSDYFKEKGWQYLVEFSGYATRNGHSNRRGRAQ
ncbi:MAG: UvrD-helicase domain-containing protein [Deltaproteobacteria bacterium]|nr:UvrD-helicase domain-containing protein [Deltaproteobacteria bacterium]